MRATPVRVPDVGRDDAPKMRLVQEDHVIEALAPDRADDAFHVRMLPRTRRCRHDLGDAHTCDTADPSYWRAWPWARETPINHPVDRHV